MTHIECHTGHIQYSTCILWFMMVLGFDCICYGHPKNGEDFAIWSYFRLAYSRYLLLTWMSVRSFVVAPGVLPTSGFVRETMAAKCPATLEWSVFFEESYQSQWSIRPMMSMMMMMMMMMMIERHPVFMVWFEPFIIFALSPIDVLIFALLAWNPGPIAQTQRSTVCVLD